MSYDEERSTYPHFSRHFTPMENTREVTQRKITPFLASFSISRFIMSSSDICRYGRRMWIGQGAVLLSVLIQIKESIVNLRSIMTAPKSPPRTSIGITATSMLIHCLGDCCSISYLSLLSDLKLITYNASSPDTGFASLHPAQKISLSDRL
jgi:hypothetical protein